MSRCARRGQCYGRAARSSSEARPRQVSPVFRLVTSQWQERKCRKLRLPLVRTLPVAPPKPPSLLRNNEPCIVHEIRGDGNCLFRCLSLVSLLL
ncbi:hypothetical protein PoB_002345600 [Plakobranchus ocellatus]|uniref:OTU domain-containing protein n=1 Tax=Plakobranchus ocellatus TaxID=259542 RepID=A0AAV3ZCJ3_9GAST|nr:hypothetical protein PoB_002345600 [Plakobranchus ocellatus]